MSQRNLSNYRMIGFFFETHAELKWHMYAELQQLTDAGMHFEVSFPGSEIIMHAPHKTVYSYFTRGNLLKLLGRWFDEVVVRFDATTKESRLITSRLKIFDAWK